MILVVGATSRVGTRVIPLLLAQGYAVRAMTRTLEKAEPLKQLGAEVMPGDLRDPASLARACQGVEQVLAAAHGFTPGQAGNNLHTVDDGGNRRLIDAARAAGVKHLVFISVLGAGPTSLLELARIKYASEQYLQASGLNYTILRAAPFMEFWATMVGEPILQSGKTTIYGRGNNPISFVSAEDVAKFCLIALQDARACNQVIEVGGPENLTFNQVAELFEKVGGQAARKSHVPLPVMRIMRLLVRPFNPMLSLQITGGILMDTEDMTCDMSATLRQYPVELIQLEKIARQMAENIKERQT
ncbi:MAG: SDR family oxidoreductase [Anaerolineae bacterium]|nr:SDR family oxidoreductase [Anaerolineae bacterium]